MAKAQSGVSAAGLTTMVHPAASAGAACRVVVAIGTGQGTHRSGTVHRFAYCDVFTFSGALVRRVESFLVPLPA